MTEPITTDGAEPSSAGEPSSGQQAIAQRAWSRQRQVRTVAIAALVAIGAVLLLWFGGMLFHRGETPSTGAPESPAGTFRATEQQLKTFTIETVGTHGFVSEELTEGKIAVNGDRTTPLYSPYSGRVVRLIAGLGDRVKQGAPLATVA
jgi:membrane fusion protein, heavy metal efflux system